MTNHKNEKPQTHYDKGFFELQSEVSLISARIVLGSVLGSFEVNSAADVGCGVGPWLKAATEHNIENILGIDGDYVDRDSLYIPPEHFLSWNLEKVGFAQEIVESSRFDLVISMEVAEHLPQERAPSFVEELCQLGDLILFSAAIPGQGGIAHINEQPLDYWAKLFAEHNYDCFDYLRRDLWHQDECAWWYLQNVLLFAKIGTDVHNEILGRSRPDPAPQLYLHPRCLAQKVAEYESVLSEATALASAQPFGRDETIRILETKIEKLRAEVLSSRTGPGYLDPSKSKLSRIAGRFRSAGRALRGKPIG